MGWRVVAGAFLTMFLIFGTAYSFASFFDSFEAEFGARRGDIALVFSLAAAIYFTMGAVAGRLADRWGPRPVIGGGLVMVGLGCMLAAQSQSLWHVYLAYGIGVGIGIGFAYVPSVGAVQPWFIKRRGFASGIAISGIGVGNLLMPPIVLWLISMIGWRASYTSLGLGVLILGALATAALARSPDHYGLLPDGDPSSKSGVLAPPAGVTLAQAAATREFKLLYISMVFGGFGMFVPFVHLAPYSRDVGLGSEFGVLLVGLIGIGSTLGRFALGGLADRMGRRMSITLMFLGSGLLPVLWLFAGSMPDWAARTTLVVFAFLNGACYGASVALFPALAADYFGSRYISGIIGVQYTSVVPGTLLGPSLAGYAFDYFRSYDIAILLSMFLTLIGCGLLFTLRDPRQQASPVKIPT